MINSITKENLFDQLLVRYYLPTAQAAYTAAPTTQEEPARRQERGRYENHSMPGLLMFYDGETVLRRIQQRFTTAPESSLRGQHKVQDANDLTRLLQDDDDNDHIFTYNSNQGILTRIKTSLDNTHYTSFFGIKRRQDVNKLLDAKLPADYVSSDIKSQPVINAGNRTRAAVVTVNSPEVNLGRQDNVRVIMISQTAYNNGTGTSLTGKISEIGKHGLVREAFIYQDKNHKGAFLDEKKHLVGVYRTYTPGANGVRLQTEHFMSVQDGDLMLSGMAKRYAA